MSIEPQSIADYVNGTLLGHYRASLITGATTGMAANGAIASLRWVDAGLTPKDSAGGYRNPRLLLLLGVDIGAVCTTAFGTAQSVDAECVIARSFTVSDSGGTAVTPIKLRSSFGTSLVGDLRVATTAALTAGTRTLDTVGFASCTIYTQNSAGGGDTQQGVYGLSREGQYPVTLSTNEGVVVRVPTAQGASGVIKYYVTLEWIEVGTEGSLGFNPP